MKLPTDQILAAIKRASAALWARLWRTQRTAPPPAEPPPVVTEAPAPPEKAKRQRLSVDDVHASGEFYFQDTILDQLDHYFKVLKRMRRVDREAYDYFHHVGLNIMPRQSIYYPEELSLRWPAALPSRGGVVFGDDEMRGDELGRWKGDDEYRICPSVFHFVKVNKRHIDNCAPTNGSVYICTMYFDHTGHKRLEKIQPGAGYEFLVSVTPDGQATALPTLNARQEPVMLKRRGTSGRGRYRIPTRRWGFDQAYVEWAAGHGKKPEELLRFVFLLTVNAWETATEGSITRVRVSKDGLSAAFAVNIERTPQFFADRDVLDSKRKKIFHIVRTHQRVTSSGKVIPVRTHFRGERQFQWNGYDVLISVPGWHHPSPYDLRAAVSSSEKVLAERGSLKGYADSDKTGRKIADSMTRSGRPAGREAVQ